MEKTQIEWIDHWAVLISHCSIKFSGMTQTSAESHYLTSSFSKTFSPVHMHTLQNDGETGSVSVAWGENGSGVKDGGPLHCLLFTPLKPHLVVKPVPDMVSAALTRPTLSAGRASESLVTFRRLLNLRRMRPEARMQIRLSTSLTLFSVDLLNHVEAGMLPCQP